MIWRSLVSSNAARPTIRALIRGVDGTSGSVLVEFALFAPVLVALAVYTVDFGLLALNKMEVQNAAQAGAQYAIGQVSYDGSAISTAVTHATKFTAVTPTSSEFCGCPTASGVQFCAASCDTCSAGTCPLTKQGHYVTVNATPINTYTPLAPFGIAAASYNISAQSTVRIK